MLDTLDELLVTRARSRVGATLGGKYRLDALLGIGGMAAVYRATHRNGAVFAIKLLHPEYGMRGDVRARFMREGYIANSIKHVGVARVVDDEASESGDVYIVMELLEGVAVDRLASHFGERLPLRAVVALAVSILDVLAAAHAAGVVHRDIKPGNLFVAFDGRAVLLDFGIARVYDAANAGGLSTAAGVVLGTPAFMAPEQATAEKSSIGPRTDLWSLAAAMFTSATGRTVHVAEHGPQFLVLAATRSAPPIREVLADVPAPIAAVIDRALERDPAARFADAEAMRDALIAASREAYGSVPGQAELALLFAPLRTTGGVDPADAVTQTAIEHVPVALQAPTPATPPAADAFFRAVVQTARDLGVDADAALAAAGVDLAAFAAGAHATRAELVDFFERASAIAAEPSLGVKIAFALPLGATGALDYATRTSRTMGEALRRLSRIYGFVTDRVGLDIEEDGDRVRLISCRPEGAPTGPQITEFVTALILMRAREALRSAVPLVSIHLTHARIAGAMDLAETFGAPVFYEQRQDEIVLPRSVLYLPFETSDPLVAEVLEQHTERFTKRPTTG